EARSEGAGRGSEFAVWLPLAPPERADAVASAGVQAGDEPAGATAARLRIVVVDDNRDAADALASLLELLGADVTVAYGGESALDAIRERRPRLALVDLGMPVVDGFELARRVRSDPTLDGVSLVALSGWGQDEDRRKSRAAGFDRHLVKPVDRGVLEELLAALGERRRSDCARLRSTSGARGGAATRRARARPARRPRPRPRPARAPSRRSRA